ncbi:Glu/Leu/Phe/Val dehydrogenase dimerization domain-containing protein [Arthrobacter sp. WCS2018Hpa-7]|uniref:Glu/Leu/Phe/Val family dehydrogenase n=1 Tax=Arthrobacter sp. WCS2018Hpa-7 TaxID=3073632 RepID=UPI0028833DD0|nr:Glu/Leu/Phe/Val dehydrogenase dimerization domain-containing protein [Arthrobacter sp. WCS2018Hpa-7]
MSSTLTTDLGGGVITDLSCELSGTHESVKVFRDKATGLHAIVALHNTVRGPALGGTRFFAFESDAAALNDVLRLSEGMTYKAAAAGLPLGGGKAVIVGEPATIKTPELLRAYGRFVDSFAGSYITAGDVGTTSSDMDHIGESTNWVVGRNATKGGSGDSGYSTALGVFTAMAAAARTIWGSEGLTGRSVGVEGAGKVGKQLINMLLETGADVVLAESHPASMQRALTEHPDIRIAPSVIDAEVDVYAPCAMGATLNPKTVPSIQARLVCGAANNQLLNAEVENQLAAQEILWVPDYVANAGGLIQVASEIDVIQPDEVGMRIGHIGLTVTEILRIAEERSTTPGNAADTLVRTRLGAGSKK